MFLDVAVFVGDLAIKGLILLFFAALFFGERDRATQ